MKEILPIGSVCETNDNQLLMIVAYKPPNYENKLKQYDYLGCPYPEGIFSYSKMASFDKSDIKNVVFEGMKNNRFSSFIDKMFPDDTKEKVVINKNPFVSTISNETDNYDNEWSIFKEIKFDENGTVISATTNKPIKNNDSNFKEFESHGIVFDENGVVIADNREKKIKEPQQIESGGFVFDENGVVIADNREKKIKKPQQIESGGFVFDESGTVIADNRQKKEPHQIESNGFVFDENGTIIADNRKKEAEKKKENLIY